ncbi:MAG TPA: hypothetical protein VLV55_12615 [Rhizomicrobium sp.]|nr:hypothetical protein [Rhizomicrobium sp.]
MMKRAVLLAGAFALVSGGAYAQGTMSQPGAAAQGAAETGSSMAQSAMGAGEQPVSEVTDANTLNNDTVQDATGASIGTVRKVVIGAGGRPTAIQVDAITTAGKRTVTIRASQARFDRNRNLITTTLTKSQVTRLPAASGT